MNTSTFLFDSRQTLVRSHSSRDQNDNGETEILLACDYCRTARYSRVVTRARRVIYACVRLPPFATLAANTTAAPHGRTITTMTIDFPSRLRVFLWTRVAGCGVLALRASWTSTPWSAFLPPRDCGYLCSGEMPSAIVKLTRRRQSDFITFTCQLTKSLPRLFPD